MDLSTLHHGVHKRKKKKRVARGVGSGHGKTSTRGAKGQWASAGAGHPRFHFEGGQMPLFRRMPKRGFNNARHTTAYLPVNLEDLNRFDDGARVDALALKSVGLANGKAAGIKILGNGELTKKLTVSAHAFSASAKQKIEAKGGTVELIAKSVVQAAHGSAIAARAEAAKAKEGKAKTSKAKDAK